MRRLLILLSLTLLTIQLYAQDDSAPTPPISADNITALAPSTQIDFDAQFYDPFFPSPNPEATPDPDGRGEPIPAAEFETGWFVSDDAGRYAIQTVDQGLWVVDADYTRWYRIQPPRNADELRPTFIDAVFNDNPQNSARWPLFAVYADSQRYTVMVEDGGIYGNPLISFFVNSTQQPGSIWSTCATDNNYDCNPVVELTDPATSEGIVWQLPSNNQLTAMQLEFSTMMEIDVESGVTEILYGPGADEDALIRIGRIEPPFAVTTSPEGAVKRWDLGQGVATAEATVENGPAVFGQLSADGRYLTWRDPMNETLYLLDFENGENRTIADLNGDYAQFLFVTNDASVILGVHINDDPVVVAWDTATGDRVELGEYRECSRELDMARLSADDTTLTIGCDTGLEIWQIATD